MTKAIYVLNGPNLNRLGRREPEMRTIAGWIGQVLASADDKKLQEKIRGQARELGQQFPAPPNDLGA